MCAVNRREHELRSPFLATYRGNSDATTPYPTHWDNLRRKHSLPLGKTLNTGVHHISLSLPYHENLANSSFTCFHCGPRLGIPGYSTNQPYHKRGAVSPE